MNPDVTLRQLRYFVALADTRHYRKAAELVGVSQPSLSQQIVGAGGSIKVGSGRARQTRRDPDAGRARCAGTSPHHFGPCGKYENLRPRGQRRH